MAATCPKCRQELPRRLLWKALKSGTLDKAEITCPRCEQVLRITPKSLATILALTLLPHVAIVPWLILSPDPRSPEIIIPVLLLLIPLTFALLTVLYLKLARFQEKPSTTSNRS
jgi:hypothetical protein